MFCPKCGKETEDGELFCGNCGAKMETEPAPKAGKSAKKKKSPLLIMLIVIAIALAGALAVLLVMKDRLSASTMRIHGFEGNVSLADSKGNDLEAAEGKRIVDGNVLDTGKESRAWVLLDEDRLVTLMERSSASFHKKGNDLKLTLTDGSLFFNISDKLSDDESFEISTSTMVIGIRGTSGFVDSDEDGNSVLYLTSGKVQVTGIAPDGKEKKKNISSGQKVTVIIEDGEVKLIVEDITEEDLPRDAVEEILSDKKLLKEVCSENDWDEDELRLVLETADAGEGDEDEVSDIEDEEDEEEKPAVHDLTMNDEGYILLGSYEQDNDTSDGAEPIEWEVLGVDDNGVLLISRYILDQVDYNNVRKDVTWETCYLRAWLANEFYYNAFTDEEREALLTVTLPNPDNQYDGYSGGSDTTDTIFCLSIEDIKTFYDFGHWTDDDINNSDRLKIHATEYALAQGVFSSDMMYGSNWWLRTPGSGSSACFVRGDGLVGWLLDMYVDYDGNPLGIRPAIYISVDDARAAGVDTDYLADMNSGNNVITDYTDNYLRGTWYAEVANMSFEFELWEDGTARVGAYRYVNYDATYEFDGQILTIYDESDLWVLEKSGDDFVGLEESSNMYVSGTTFNPK